MRLFLAFSIGDAAREAVATTMADLRAQVTAGSIKWVERENLHVTMRFLGELEGPRAASLQTSLEVPLGTPRFTLVLGGGGCFPAAGQPRVIWIGVATGAHEARRVFAELDQRLSASNIPKEPRPYAPHLTVGRVREISKTDARRLRVRLEQVPSWLASVEVRSVTLYRSHLGPRGPRYEPLMATTLADDSEAS